MTRVSITATKKGLTDRQKATVRTRLRMLQPEAVIHGGCVGGDDEIDIIAAELGIYRIIHPSDRPALSVPKDVLKARGPCTYLEPRPPLERNPDIVFQGTRLLACPKESTGETLRSGTWATVRFARRLPGYKKGTYPIEVIRP